MSAQLKSIIVMFYLGLPLMGYLIPWTFTRGRTHAGILLIMLGIAFCVVGVFAIKKRFEEAGNRWSSKALRVFVRWNGEGEGYDRVEVVEDGTVILNNVFCNNRERLYGWCSAVVTVFREFGAQISMPRCLQRHLTYDTSRED